MATTSSAASVKAALVTLVTAAVADTTVQVTYGRPQDSMLKRDCVWFGRTSGADRIPVMSSGRKVREQSYSIQVVIFVAKPNGTVQAAEARALVLLGKIEDALANDPSLGGVDGLIHATAGDWELEAEQAMEGPFALVTFDVDCLSRLS